MDDSKPYTQKLGMDHISLLNGVPISLTSEFGNKKILSMNTARKLGFIEPKNSNYETDVLDQKWHLIKTNNVRNVKNTSNDLNSDDSLIIVSEKLGEMICHNIEDDCEVHSRPFSSFTDGCEWNIGKKGELYYKDPFDIERYLWIADDKLYVTNDGYIAEQWIPYFHIKREESNNFSNGWHLWKILVVILVIYLGYVFLKK